MVSHLYLNIPTEKLIASECDSTAGPSSEVVNFMRVTLGIPVVITMTHPLVAGPVTNTLFHDFQRFPSQSSSNGYAHVGAPSATLECKLLGVEDDVVKSGVYEGEVSDISDTSDISMISPLIRDTD